MKYLRLAKILSNVKDCEAVEFERLTFNGGENHIKIHGSHVAVTIECLAKSADNVMELLMAVDALRRSGTQWISLFLPYVPYARQDRVMVPGEPLSVKVFCDMINALNLKAVYTLDNHSGVATALLNKCVEVDYLPLLDGIARDCILISPDAGSEKKVAKAAKRFGLDIVTCSKVRQPSTGKIIDTRVNTSDLHGKDCLIIDDICDGGRTFIEIARRLATMNPGRIDLYVSHGIFSRGIEPFHENFNTLYTANLFNHKLKDVESLPITKEML
jgi:ribose-phosphate pyrophosphokinase